MVNSSNFRFQFVLLENMQCIETLITNESRFSGDYTKQYRFVFVTFF